jgi:hypothetical protein
MCIVCIEIVEVKVGGAGEHCGGDGVGFFMAGWLKGSSGG